MGNRSIIWYENEKGQYKGNYTQWGADINNSFVLDIGYQDQEKIEKLVNSEKSIYSLGLSEKGINYDEYEKLRENLSREITGMKNLEDTVGKKTIYSDYENDIPLLENREELFEYIRNSEMINNHYSYEKGQYIIYSKNEEHENGIEVTTLNKVKELLLKDSENQKNYNNLKKLNAEIEELTKDSDFDGLTDKEEMEKYQTDPYSIDSDGDGISDYKEVRENFTNPTENNKRIDFRYKEKEKELEI